MKKKSNNQHPVLRARYTSSEFEDAVYDSRLHYSLRHLTAIGQISAESTNEALKKSLHVCYMAGINSAHHFKQIYIFDTLSETLRVDWRMSKTGFSLLLIHSPSVNERIALWLWKLVHQQTTRTF